MLKGYHMTLYKWNYRTQMTILPPPVPAHRSAVIHILVTVFRHTGVGRLPAGRQVAPGLPGQRLNTTLWAHALQNTTTMQECSATQCS